jgi:hypothetical protein
MRGENATGISEGEMKTLQQSIDVAKKTKQKKKAVAYHALI